MILSAGAIGTAGAQGHTTGIDEPTVIDEPGRYELVDDITTEGNSGIEILANNVTLEGSGYTISTRGTGIEINSVSDITIQNVSLQYN